MKSIDTLIPDIYRLVGGRSEDDKSQGITIPAELIGSLSTGVANRIQEHFAQRGPGPKLRMSRLGEICPRALWYEAHHPELAEALPPWAKIKYAYGHLIEALAICLARAAGHEVTGEQDVIELDGVQGHRDCVIDGCVVDVKSCSSRAFIKFKDRTLHQDDPFGYLEQLDAYLCGSADDPLVSVKDKGYLWAIDKTLGHMVLYEHKARNLHIRQRIAYCKSLIASRSIPECNCGVVPDGKSGNLRLDTKASYSAYKYCCFPNLRTFLYSTGPVYLTKVVRKPDVPEIDKFGKILYT